jgi:hypothetical protein
MHRRESSLTHVSAEKPSKTVLPEIVTSTPFVFSFIYTDVTCN